MKLEERIKAYVAEGHTVYINLSEGMGIMVVEYKDGGESDFDLGEMGGDMSPYERAGATIFYDDED